MKTLRSDTALLIAAGAVYCAQRGYSKDLVPAEDLAIATAVLGQTMRGRVILATVNSGLLRPLWYFGERRFAHGMFAHFRVRKLLIAQEVSAAIVNGARQIVNLGAGYDGLAYRLHMSHPGTGFWEVDRPIMCDIKRRSLPQPPAKNFRLVPADLAAVRVQEALRDTGFRPDVSSVFILEGLTMYLDAAQVTALLRDIRAVSAPGSVIVMTYLDLDASGKPTFHGANAGIYRWLKDIGEPFRWGCRPGELANFLARCQLKLINEYAPGESDARQLTGLDRLIDGERIAVAAPADG